ncbi:MAG: hypothetical protein KF799_05615 [Bdellovibrionales bacterium]|nr:hypothetical protein [Bdellovibrionales bacterium]
MEFLKPVAVALTALALAPTIAGAANRSAPAWAASQDGVPYDPREKLIAEQAKSLCNSTDEYIKTLQFLRTTKEILIPEASARKVADKVARGCNGAAERFEKILLLMKSSGLSDPKSLETALRFSSYSPDVQKNFSEIFSRAFLAEFFDYDHSTAVALAFELSRDYEGEPAHVRDDFIYLAQLCKDGKEMDLPSTTCSEYAVKVAKLSALFPNGIRSPFQTLYKKLREDRDFGMDVKTALDFTYRILKHGPRAPDNFMDAYAYGMKESGLALGRNQALEFAVRMARNSYIGKTPPVIPAAPQVKNAAMD